MMAQRITDTDLWKRRWFRRLSPDYKLAFLYIQDRCDYAGVWDIDVVELLDITGIEDFDMKQFLHEVNTDLNTLTGEQTIKERVIFDDEFLVITGFMALQYKNKDGRISPRHMIARKAIDRLRSYNLLSTFIERSYVTFTEELPEHRAARLAKKSPKSRKKEELNEQATYLNMFEDMTDYEDRMYEDTKLKRLEIIRDEMKFSTTLYTSVSMVLGVDDTDKITPLIDWYCNIILGSGHYLKNLKEVKRYFINKINHSKAKLLGENDTKFTGSAKQIEALKKYLQ